MSVDRLLIRPGEQATFGGPETWDGVQATWDDVPVVWGAPEGGTADGQPIMLGRHEAHDTTWWWWTALGPALNQQRTNRDLLGWLDGVGRLLGQVDDLVRPGWDRLLDPTAADHRWLPWLAQWTGADPDSTGLRQEIVDRVSWQRGTPEAIVDAVRRVGPQTVLLEERVGGDPAAVRVTVLAAETVDEAAVVRAVAGAMPAGLTATVVVEAGSVYSEVVSEYATYADLTAAHPTYSSLRAWDPGA